jgi:peptidoglycan-N-acetylglucosamine deacetylase
LVAFRSRAWSLVVLHDLPTGAMSHIGEFLKRLREDGFELTQQFPSDCVPVLDGKIKLPLNAYVTQDASRMCAFGLFLSARQTRPIGPIPATKT